MSGHPHAELMAKAAEIAKTDKKWYRHFQFKTSDDDIWRDFCGVFGFHESDVLRLKPRTIDINGHQVPEPVREPLNLGQKYWVADTANFTEEKKWTDSFSCQRWLARGILHLTKEAAETHIAALLSFTQK